MDLLLDTHIIAWIGMGSPKLSANVRTAIEDVDNRLCVSSVVAYEYVDLTTRGRLPAAISLGTLIDDLELVLLEYPSDAWQAAEVLPQIHRDPVDRMLIAHALCRDLTLVTEDKAIQRYPVKCLR